jgi:hypothetical protein
VVIHTMVYEYSKAIRSQRPAMQVFVSASFSTYLVRISVSFSVSDRSKSRVHPIWSSELFISAGIC